MLQVVTEFFFNPILTNLSDLQRQVDRLKSLINDFFLLTNVDNSLCKNLGGGTEF